jgi:methylmalonyl-CoA mutase N-terminal domain/subunit
MALPDCSPNMLDFQQPKSNAFINILLQDKRTINRFRFVHRGMIQITNVVGDVGKAGVAGDTMEDMKVLFDQNSLIRNVSQP